MKNTTLFVTIPLLLAPLLASAVTINFDELDASSTAVENGTFTSKGVSFVLNYNATYASWDGIALSDAGWKYSETSDYSDQFLLASPTAETEHTDAGNNYAVVYDPGAYGSSPEIDLPYSLTAPQYMYVTNTTYTWATMMNGDSYGISTPFATGSWYLLTATGYDANGGVTGTKEYYLADYRDSEPLKHYAITEFSKMDLTPLGTDVSKIKFTITSSDTGTYGINTPAYFAFDNLVVTGDLLWNVVQQRTSSWYGDVYAYQINDGWIYSYDNAAFQYVTGTSDDAWIYDEQLGWCWTSADTYSYIYLYDYGTWAYLYQESPASADKRAYYIYDSTYSAQLPKFPYATAADLAAIEK